MARGFNNFIIKKYSSRSLKCGTYFPSNTSIVNCVTGSATIEINSHKFEIVAGMNFLLNSTSIVKITSISRNASCTILQISSKFIGDYCPFITNHIFDTVGLSTPESYTKEDIHFGTLMFKQLEMVRTSRDYSLKNIVVANLFSNYIINVYESLRKRAELSDSIPLSVSNRADSLLAKFWQLCKEHHKTEHKVEYYAHKLNISSRYLHRLSKEQFGITPKQVIDYCLINSAKRLLITTDKTNQEISIELNFPDSATFGQFFKRNNGVSPLQFRRKA